MIEGRRIDGCKGQKMEEEGIKLTLIILFVFFFCSRTTRHHLLYH